MNDPVKFGQGNRFSLEHLWNEFREFDADDRLTSFRVPIYFLLGDTTGRSRQSWRRGYSERINAPVKRLVWFEQSAHNPPFEEPALFNRTLIDLLETGKTTDKTSETGP